MGARRQKVEKSINQFFLYFFRGLLMVAPFGATFYLISVTLKKVDKLISFGIPGLGILIVISSITLLGYIGSTLLIQSVFGFTESLIGKIPFISKLYSSLKDFTSAFANSKGKFDKPVLLKVSRMDDIYRIGFITQSQLDDIGLHDYLAVYLPNSYDISGMLVLVQRELIKPLDMESADVMKFIVSGAVVASKDHAQNDNVHRE